MTDNNKIDRLHKFYGEKRRRMTYQKKDFLDYTIMIAICAVLVFFTFGAESFMTVLGLFLCAFMVVMFPLRHGLKLSVPLIIRKPQEALYLLVHKVQNARWIYYAAIAALLLENLIIYVTPDWPHETETMHQVAIFVFWAQFVLISAFRTTIFISHWWNSEHVREVLMQSSWKSQLNRQPNIKLEIVFAYFTGLLTHIVYLAPWYLVIHNFEFSLVLMPLFVAANLFLQYSFVKVVGEWFYRDHWLGHNSEWDFIYSHGTHHDAIPSGMIAVAGNGHLEGFFRGAVAFPIPFFNPVIAGIIYTLDMYIDITEHQYIPGLFPKINRDHRLIGQHSLHHFGRLEPFGFGFKVDQSGVPESALTTYKLLPPILRNSINLDEELNGYEWDNPRQRWYLKLIDKYNDRSPESGDLESDRASINVNP